VLLVLSQLGGDARDVKLENGFQYFFSLMRPTSVGSVELRSANPADSPKFQFNYLTTEQDRRDAIDAVKEIRRLSQPTMWRPAKKTA
jgi:choline dehydrogenase